jgi:general secretion pathway protein G
LLVVIGIIATLIALLLPTLNASRESAKTVTCLSNLRQLAAAAQIYVNTYYGSYPIAQYSDFRPPISTAYSWDFTVSTNINTGQQTVVPGILWQGITNPQVLQCPSYYPAANSTFTPYSGYNYNTSYIGHGRGEYIVAPARQNQVHQPQRCALFGDGQYNGGADKFMRSPFPPAGDNLFSAMASGTQGFRHRGLTNVVFCDSHAETLGQRFTTTTVPQTPLVAPGTGFLSGDNGMYDLH